MFCENCKYWEPNKDRSAGMCDKVDSLCRIHRSDLIQKPKPNEMGLYVDAHDDSGLTGELWTGPKFGCVQFMCFDFNKILALEIA